MAAKWQRLGYASAAAYRQDCATATAKKNAALGASRVRLGGRIVLMHLIQRSEFHNMQVTITKPQIERDTGLCMKTVKAAMAALRDAGTITPVHNFEGGRGRAVTYEIAAPISAAQPERVEPDEPDAERLKQFSQNVTRYGYSKAREMDAESEDGRRQASA